MDTYERGVGFDIRVEARLKNGALVAAREALGLSTIAAAVDIGIGYTRLLKIENLKVYPKAEEQKQICDYYRSKKQFLFEDDVFPEELREVAKAGIGKIKRHRTVDSTRLIDIPRRMMLDNGPEETVLKSELEREVNDALKCLNPMQERMLRMRYGFDGEPQTAAQIGEFYSYTDANVLRILNKGTKQLQKILALYDQRDPNGDYETMVVESLHKLSDLDFQVLKLVYSEKMQPKAAYKLLQQTHPTLTHQQVGDKVQNLPKIIFNRVKEHQIRWQDVCRVLAQPGSYRRQQTIDVKV